MIDDRKYVTDTGVEMHGVHTRDKCAGRNCPIHNPSDHPLKNAKTHWRSDRGIMERICEHGIGHPDPDDIRVQSSWSEGVHGCDGCCTMNSLSVVKRQTEQPVDIIVSDEKPGQFDGNFMSYKESWKDLRSAVEGLQKLSGYDTISIDKLLEFMDKKEQRMQ